MRSLFSKKWVSLIGSLILSKAETSSSITIKKSYNTFSWLSLFSTWLLYKSFMNFLNCYWEKFGGTGFEFSWEPPGRTNFIFSYSFEFSSMKSINKLTNSQVCYALLPFFLSSRFFARLNFNSNFFVMRSGRKPSLFSKSENTFFYLVIF